MAKKVLIISPEIYPKVKVGGLGKMVAGVAKGLAKRGVEVKTFSPSQNIYRSLWKKQAEVEYRKLGWQAGQYCQKNQWRPDYLWVHDWGGVWAVDEFAKSGRFGSGKIVWTIHSPLGDNYDYSYGYGYQGEDEPIDWGDSFFDFSDLVKQGVELADLVTTVSPGFANRLNRHSLFQNVDSIIGISNGLDVEAWDPSRDQLIDFKFKNSWLEFKERNKQVLQKKFNLPIRNVPIFSFVSRVASQKGIELLLKALLNFVAKNDIQFIFVGSGEKRLVHRIKALSQQFPSKVGAKLKADFDLPHQVFAGADFLVLPSLSEPFGIVVAEAKKYGVVPIVHLIDGLKDQVQDNKNGFGFWNYHQEKLEKKLYQGLNSWQSEWQKNQWKKNKTDSWIDVSQKWLKVFYEYSS